MAFNTSDGGRPPLVNKRQINLYTDETPDGPTKNTQYSRPALEVITTLGLGAIRATFQWGRKRITSSGVKIFRDAVENGMPSGTISATGPVRYAYSDEEVVIVGGGKAYLLSDNNWTVRTFPTAVMIWRGCSYSPSLGLFVAVSYAGTAGIRAGSSPDGVTWTARNTAADLTWVDVAWSPSLGLFATVATDGTGQDVMTSPDGINWTRRNTPGSPRAWAGLVWAAGLGLFVATCYTNGVGNRIMTSPDGINWTLRATPVDNQWFDVDWSPSLSLLVAVAVTGTGNRVMTSSNGTAWTARTSAADNSWRSVAWSSDLSLFAAVSNSGAGNRVMTSPDGINWTSRVSAADVDWVKIIWVSGWGLFVATATTGVGNRIMTSPDGITWSLRATPSDIDWIDMVYAPDKDTIVAVAATATANNIMTAHSALLPITDPDLPSTLIDVFFSSGRFGYVDGNSSSFWWSDIGDAASIDGLAFATEAEGEALVNVGTAIMAGQIAFFTVKGIEWWDPNNDIDAPFLRSAGRHVDKGTTAIESIRAADNTLFFVGSQRIVYRVSDVPEVVSDSYVEEALRALTDAELAAIPAYVIVFAGREFYVMNLPTTTWAYDIKQKDWAEWASTGRSHFRPYCSDPTYRLLGDTYSGRIYGFDGTKYADEKDDTTVTDYIDRTFGIFYPLKNGSLRNFNAVLKTKRGVGLSSGQGVAPVASMRYSDDDGVTFTAWVDATLGALGVRDNSAKAVWLHLGTIQSPGRLFEFRCTDPVEYMPYDVLINVPRP